MYMYIYTTRLLLALRWVEREREREEERGGGQKREKCGGDELGASPINRLALSFQQLSQVADLVLRGSLSRAPVSSSSLARLFRALFFCLGIYRSTLYYDNMSLPILIISYWMVMSTEAAPQDLGSPIRIAQCRALCLDKVNLLLQHFSDIAVN